MGRRLAALVLALVVTGAPSALAACEIACVLTDGRPLSGSHTSAHTCHGTARSESPTIRGAFHICGHDDELPAAASQTPFLLAPCPPAAVPAQTLSLHENGTALRAHGITLFATGSSTFLPPLRI